MTIYEELVEMFFKDYGELIMEINKKDQEIKELKEKINEQWLIISKYTMIAKTTQPK